MIEFLSIYGTAAWEKLKREGIGNQRMGKVEVDSNRLSGPQQEAGQTKPGRAEAEEMNRQLRIGFGKFIDQIYPWLNEVGIVIFGGLIALNLVILASLFTIGPVDTAVKIATAAFAFALPLEVTGLLLLRLVRESKNLKFEDRLAQAFQEAGFTSDQIPENSAFPDMREKRAKNAVRMSMIIMALSFLLLLAGLIATLWHMAWWIAVGFFVLVVICFIVLV